MTIQNLRTKFLWVGVALLVSVVALGVVSLAFGPDFSSAQGTDTPKATATPTPTPTAVPSGQKLDISMAGLVALHKSSSQGSTRSPRDPLLSRSADAFIRLSRDIDDTKSFLETGRGTVVISRGTDSGYILAQVPVSLIERVAQRAEVTEVSSGVVGYMDPLVKIFVDYHDAGNGTAEKLLVHLEVPFTYDDYFLGRAKGIEAGTANVAKLRSYLTGQEGVEVIQTGGNGVVARVPLGLLRELSEMPFVDAVMVNDPSVPGLTSVQSSKVVHMDLAEIMAAQVAGVSLPTDANFANNRRVEVTDGTVRIAIEIAGDDATAEATNGQTIKDFLTRKGGSSESANDSSIGAFVWGGGAGVGSGSPSEAC